MASVISFLFGILLGVPFGWILLICLEDWCRSKSSKRPPTKDEWKVM